MDAMTTRRFGFDPNSAGARRLLLTAQAAAPVEVVISEPGQIIGGHIYGRDEIVAVSSLHARRLIEAGVARYPQD
jgi:hypothetical protein